MPLSQITVDLVDSMGNDLKIVNSARQSFGKESTGYGEREFGILRRLLKDRHASPFESVTVTYQVKAPIRVAREHMRHRTAAYSEFSLRYAQFPNEFFVWSAEDIRTQQGKAMEYTFIEMDEQQAIAVAQMLNAQAQSDLDVYESLLALGVAREVASYCLPLSSMTTYSVTTNLRNALNFLHLRTAPAALREIREVARQLECELVKVVPDTMDIWRAEGRPQI